MENHPSPSDPACAFGLNPKSKLVSLAIVVLLSTVIFFTLGRAIWDMNFWPSDEKVYYFDAAVDLPHFKHLSQIHQNIDEGKVRWLHGKEIFILAISLAQRALHDVHTLRPFLVVGLLAVWLSSILVYLLGRRYGGNVIGLICYFLFTFCVWPYVYLLFAKHQTLGLCLFLLAVYLLPSASTRRFRWARTLFSGVCWGLSLSCSTVSPLYAPYYLAAFFYPYFIFGHRQIDSRTVLTVLKEGAAVLAGVLAIFVYVNYPEINRNVALYGEYVHISGAFNHFFYNQPHLQQWFPQQMVASVRGGWIWICKYLFLIMPVLFPAYLSGLGYLIFKVFQKRNPGFAWRTGSVILLSAAPVLLAELVQVAQYGANYFPELAGVILLLGYAVFIFQQEEEAFSIKRFGLWAGVLAAAVHLTLNLHLLVTDVYPCRMATTFLSRKIDQLGISKVYTHMINPHRNFFVMYLNPTTYQRLQMTPVNFITNSADGYVLVAPVTGDSIYLAATSSYADFDADPFLVELIRQGKLGDYAVASFKTLSCSRIWLQEEEILTYRDLVLGHNLAKRNEVLGRVWLLDAKKIRADVSRIIPDKDSLTLLKENIRNIGTRQKFYLYTGHPWKLPASNKVRSVVHKIYRVGDPTDGLELYLYKVDPQEKNWAPVGKSFFSRTVPAEKVSADPQRPAVEFSFDPPLDLPVGRYLSVIYRTGPLDDRNFYRIYQGEMELF